MFKNATESHTCDLPLYPPTSNRHMAQRSKSHETAGERRSEMYPEAEEATLIIDKHQHNQSLH